MKSVLYILEIEIILGTLYVALELIPHGNLRSYLRERRKADRRQENLGNLSEQLMKFSMEVANGMRHLEDIGVSTIEFIV